MSGIRYPDYVIWTNQTNIKTTVLPVSWTSLSSSHRRKVVFLIGASLSYNWKLPEDASTHALSASAEVRNRFAPFHWRQSANDWMLSISMASKMCVYSTALSTIIISEPKNFFTSSVNMPRTSVSIWKFTRHFSPKNWKKNSLFYLMVCYTSKQVFKAFVNPY